MEKERVNADEVANEDQKIIDIVRILKADPAAREVVYEILDEDKRAARVANTVKRFLNRRVELSLKFPNGGENSQGDKN